MNFEWDPAKEARNIKKHNVSFKEAVTILGNPLSITIHDPDHSEDEDRYLTVGCSSKGGFLIVAHTERGDNIRIINARKLTKSEKKSYEEKHRY